MPRAALARHKNESIRLSHGYPTRDGWNCTRQHDIRVSLHSGPHVKKSLIIAIKTPSRFAPEPSSSHIFLEQRAHAILWIAKPFLQHVHNVHANVQANKVRQLQRPHRMVHPQLHRSAASARGSKRTPARRSLQPASSPVSPPASSLYRTWRRSSAARESLP